MKHITQIGLLFLVLKTIKNEKNKLILEYLDADKEHLEFV